MSPENLNSKFSLSAIMFYFSLLFLVGVIGTYFVLNYFQNQAEEEAKKVQETLSRQQSPEERQLEQEILSYRQRLNDFPVLLSNHKIPSEFFRKLESLTHPRISFAQVKIQPAENIAEISGKAYSFEVIGQQYEILKNSEGIFDRVDLNKLMLDPEGKIDFGFSLVLNPDLLTFK